MTTTHTLSDLSIWPDTGTSTSLAVIGHPINHSLSPALHNAALAEMSLAHPQLKTWRYHRFDIPPEQLPAALPLFHQKNFTGLNLTLPHKILALKLAATISPDALAIGAINTLTRTPAGWHGTNTDAPGLDTAIQRHLHQTLSNNHVLILGAGGAARAAAHQALAQNCASLTLLNRTESNLHELLSQLAPLAQQKQIPLTGASTPENANIPANTLIINATSLGLRPDDPSPLNLTAIPRPLAVFDMIYNPPQTALLIQAAHLGIPTSNGLPMLIHQAALALEQWTTLPVPTAPMFAAAH